MRNGGLSKARLGRMDDVMAGHIERGGVPGLVTLLSRRGEVHVNAIGTKAVAGRAPMERDTIFRIASLTKPIVAAAAMILVEMVGILMTQRAWTSPSPPDVCLDFWTSAYQAIDD